MFQNNKTLQPTPSPTMSPVIRIPESTYKRLQKLATPFVDKPSDVIDRLLDEYEQRGTERVSKTMFVDSTVLQLDPLRPDDLGHTRVLEARLNGRTLRPKWNYLVIAVHQLALERLGSFDMLKKMTLSNIVQGERSDSGFKYVAETDFSIQYTDSNHSWQNSLHLAMKLDFEIEVHLEWMHKDKAVHPGQRAKLFWKPSNRS